MTLGALRDCLEAPHPSRGGGDREGVSLLEGNLRLTPTERIEQLQRMTELCEALRPKDAPNDARTKLAAC